MELFHTQVHAFVQTGHGRRVDVHVSQVLHIPLVFGMNSFLQTLLLLASAILLGFPAGVFEDTARCILFKFTLKNTRSWTEGILVGLGHGAIEAMLPAMRLLFIFIGIRTPWTLSSDTGWDEAHQIGRETRA